jgi:hypothetical protein
MIMRPTSSELECALAYLRGDGDLVGKLGHSLSGKVSEIYELLRNSDEFAEEERR